MQTIEGSTVGNGAGEALGDLALWLGEEPVRTCAILGVDVLPSVFPDENSLRHPIEEAQERVRNYIARHHKIINGLLEPTDSPLIMNHEWVGRCEGQDKDRFYSDRDLAIAIGDVTGKAPQEWLKAWKRERARYVNPRAFYWVEPSTTGRKKASIWIENTDLRVDPALAFSALLTHELLHTAGCGHGLGNITDYGDLIRTLDLYNIDSRDTRLRARLTSIDWPDGRDLIFCDSCEIDQLYWVTQTPDAEALIRLSANAEFERSAEIQILDPSGIKPTHQLELFMIFPFERGHVGEPIFQIPVIRNGKETSVFSWSEYRGYLVYTNSFYLFGFPNTDHFELWRNRNSSLELWKEEKELKVRPEEVKNP